MIGISRNSHSYVDSSVQVLSGLIYRAMSHFMYREEPTRLAVSMCADSWPLRIAVCDSFGLQLGLGAVVRHLEPV